MAGIRSLTIVVVLLGAAVAAGLALRGADLDAPRIGATAPTPPGPPTSPTAPREASAVRVAAVTTGRISGEVHDPNHHPIAGAEVRILVAVGKGTEWRTPVATDSRGAFELIDVPHLPVAVHAAAPGFVAGKFDGLCLVDVPGHHLELAPLVLQRAVVYHGIVVAGGCGVPGATLRLMTLPDAPQGTARAERSTQSGLDGRFAFTEPPALPCLLTVQAGGYRHVEPRTIVAANDLAVIEVEPLGRITGRVVDAASGEPLPRARLRTKQTEPPIFLSSDRGFDETVAVGPDGSFDLQQPDALAFVLEASEPDHSPATLGPFEVGAANGPHLVRLKRGITVQGTLTCQGQPTGGFAQLRGEGTNPPRTVAANVGPDGAVRLPAVPPGRYVLTIDPNSGPQLERTLHLFAPGPVVLDLEVGLGARLVGTVRGGSLGDRIVCVHANGHQRFAWMDALGKYDVNWLAAGEWRVIALPKRDITGRLTKLWQLLDQPAITLGAGQVVHRDLIAAPGLVAAMTCPLGRGALGSHVELVPRTLLQKRVPKECLRCMIGGDGTFDLDAALPGEWLVRWTPREGAVREVVVDLPAGRTTTVMFP